MALRLNDDYRDSILNNGYITMGSKKSCIALAPLDFSLVVGRPLHHDWMAAFQNIAFRCRKIDRVTNSIYEKIELVTVEY